MNTKTEFYLQAIQNALPALQGMIKAKIGFNPVLEVKLEHGRFNEPLFTIAGTENLIEQLGSTLVQTLFTSVTLNFGGGEIATTEDGREYIWFNPNVKYTHPNGGKNATQFIWNGLFFFVADTKWEVSQEVF